MFFDVQRSRLRLENLNSREYLKEKFEMTPYIEIDLKSTTIIQITSSYLKFVVKFIDLNIT